MANRRSPGGRSTRSPGGPRPGQRPGTRSHSSTRADTGEAASSANTATGEDTQQWNLAEQVAEPPPGPAAGEVTEVIATGTAAGWRGRWRRTRARWGLRRPRFTLSGPGSERMAQLLSVRSAEGERPRARFTGRAAVLLLVLAVLTVSYASSLRAYVQQRAHTTELRTQIEKRDASIRALEREKARWEDPAFQEAQARTRLRYVMPGEIGFTVIGADGKPIEDSDQVELRNPTQEKSDPVPWWSQTWASVGAAGDPPLPQAPKPDPNTEIDGTKTDVSKGKSAQ